MTVQVGDHELVLDPYDYDFHEDPYPYYQRLRDEAPLYRNEELGFWALSRHADVHQGFRNSTTLSNRFGVSLDPASRGRTPPRPCRFWRWTIRRTCGCALWCRKGSRPGGFVSSSRGSPRSPTQHLDTMLEKATVGNGRLRRGIRRQAADGRHLRTDGCPRTGPRRRSAPGPTA